MVSSLSVRRAPRLISQCTTDVLIPPERPLDKPFTAQIHALIGER